MLFMIVSFLIHPINFVRGYKQSRKFFCKCSYLYSSPLPPNSKCATIKAHPLTGGIDND